MLSVVTFKWKPFPGYRSTFGPENVNVLRLMVARHYPDPHRFICVTDDARGLDPAIEVVPIWRDHADLKHPTNPMQPSCYRRLKVFAPEMGEVLGKRIVCIDLDCVIVGDLRPLWNRREEFVGLAGMASPTTTYNGSMFLLTAGARPRVWTDFNPPYSQKNARAAGHYGSDQAWLSYILGPKEARWTTADGILSYRLHVAPSPQCGRLPKGARVVVFNGKKDPWSPEVRQYDWVQQHYR